MEDDEPDRRDGRRVSGVPLVRHDVSMVFVFAHGGRVSDPLHAHVYGTDFAVWSHHAHVYMLVSLPR